MDPIYVDPALRSQRPSKSSSEYSDEKHTHAQALEGGLRSGGLLNAMHVNVGGVVARKSYSLAPCHHLFVSGAWVVASWGCKLTRNRCVSAHRVSGEMAGYQGMLVPDT